MAFDPKQIFTFAQILFEDENLCDGKSKVMNTVKLATVINRVYYSVYLRLVDILIKEHSEYPKVPGDHGRTRRSLKNKMNRRDLIDMYSTLADDRVRVDYKLKKNINLGKDFEKLAKGSIDTAENLLRELKGYEPRNYN